jgi:hypothetical protein
VLHVVAPHQDELAARIDGGRLHDAETPVARPEKAVSAGAAGNTKVRKAQTMRAVSATTNRMVAMARMMVFGSGMDEIFLLNPY